MELLHLIRFLLRLDDRSLRALRDWVPDLEAVLNAPREALQARVIEIGSWVRYVRSYVIPALLNIPALWVISLTDSLLVTILSTLAWLLLAGVLLSTSRGGSCL